jgi:hypothetical protein
MLHRVIVDGKAFSSVIEEELLRGRKRWQRHFRLAHVERFEQTLDSRRPRLPERLSPPGNQILERSGFGERLDLVLFELRAAYEVVETREGPLTPRRFNRFPRTLADTLHETKPEAQRFTFRD